MASFQNAKSWPRKTSGTPATAGQARLDRIADAGGAAWASYRQWQPRFLRDPQYTSEWLEYRVVELQRLIPEQERLCEQMPADRPGAEYLAAHEQLQKWKGQLWALQDVLKRRAGTVGHISAASLDACGCERGSMLPTSTGEKGPDPFEF